jgi:organic radical activating enzyme
MSLDNFKKVKKELGEVSSSFCLAKWKQVTVHLQTGHTHSCHHPMIHKIPLKELENNSSALHNTNQKKLARKQMLEGERPSECEYCWKIEDSNPENFSDRITKSADHWAYPFFQEVAKAPWDSNINPSYFEVSFGNECNFKCAYCHPQISSAIMAEIIKLGPTKLRPDISIELMKENGFFPYGKDEENPYVNAFWKWWPELKNTLDVFRITGGEPLLNPNTFRFLDSVIAEPMPNLNLAINSNLGISDHHFDQFLEKIKIIVTEKKVKSFQLYTSVDTYGKNAEFVRFGLNYDQYMKNVRKFLEAIPEVDLIFMSTYNALSVINYDKYLLEVLDLKKLYMNGNRTRVYLDTPYLKDPQHLSCYVLDHSFIKYMYRDLEFMKKQNSENGLFSEYEIAKFKRIIDWVESLEESDHRNGHRKNFAFFVQEYEQRKNIKFADYCPEYKPFLEKCQKLFIT